MPIDRNIRLEKHHPRDLLVGRRSDGRRPGYQPPGGGATNVGGGSGKDYSSAPSDRGPIDAPDRFGPTTTRVAPPGEKGGAGYISPGEQNRLDIKQDIINRNLEKDYLDTGGVWPSGRPYYGQTKINEYRPTFGQRFKMGMGNLFSGLGGGLRNLAGFVNPLAFAIDNPYARTAVNYMGKKFAPDLYNKWSNQDPAWTDPDEEEDIAWENINYNPNALTRLQMEQGIMDPNIFPEERPVTDEIFTDEIFTDENLMAKVTKQDLARKAVGNLKGVTYETAIDTGIINPDMSEYEFNELQKGNIIEPGTYTI